MSVEFKWLDVGLMRAQYFSSSTAVATGRQAAWELPTNAAGITFLELSVLDNQWLEP